MKTGMLLLTLFVLVVVLLLAAAGATWSSRTAEVVAQIDAATLAPPESTFAAARLVVLPEPVERYLRAVLREGTPVVWRADVRQEGRFRPDTTLSSDEWRFHATQHFAVRPPGFVWDARMRVAPLADVFVRDALDAGEGVTSARVAGLVPLAGTKADAALNEAALQRWLAETAWFPTALLPGQAVTWTAVDDSTARATAVAGATTASLDFHFGPDSLVAWVGTDARARSVGDAYVLTPWRGRWSDWKWYEGQRIPTRGEVAWKLPTRTYTYWRGRVLEATYQ